MAFDATTSPTRAVFEQESSSPCLHKVFPAFDRTERRLFSFSSRKIGRSVECNDANRWLLTLLLPVQSELFPTRNRHHLVCIRLFQLLIEPKGVCSHSAVRKAVDRSNAMMRIDGCRRYYRSNSSCFEQESSSPCEEGIITRVRELTGNGMNMKLLAQSHEVHLLLFTVVWLKELWDTQDGRLD